MYYKVTLEDKVRVPPHRLGEDLDAVILSVLQEQLEGSISKEIGIFIVVTKVLDIGEGELIPGDGAVYYDVRFEAVVAPPGAPGGDRGRGGGDDEFRRIRQPRPHRCHAPREPDIR